VQRVRDRLAWFDGHLRVEPAGAGSRVTVALPMS
jgi:signal transduction histidine kinase